MPLSKSKLKNFYVLVILRFKVTYAEFIMYMAVVELGTSPIRVLAII